MSLGSRVQSAWNAFFNKDPTTENSGAIDIGTAYSSRPDRVKFTRGNEKSIVTAVFNRIALDTAAVSIEHVRLDDNDRYIYSMQSKLNNCLTLEANIDQTGRALIQDVVMSMLDEGCVAIVPTDTTYDPTKTDSYDIAALRVGKIITWYPTMVQVRVYNERT